MPDKNDDDFDKASYTFENTHLTLYCYYLIDFNPTIENCSSKITNSNIEKQESCCLNKLSYMDNILKNMHKRWSIFD